MTELLSQAYSKGNGLFSCPSWMRFDTRHRGSIEFAPYGKSRGINDRFGKSQFLFFSSYSRFREACPDDFQILGRFDNSDIRGCNLLVT